MAIDILYSNGAFWVIQVKTGYEVYKNGNVSSERVARIGWPNSPEGLRRAIAEADKRATIQHKEEQANEQRNRLRSWNVKPR